VTHLSETEHSTWSWLALPALFIRLKKTLNEKRPDAVISSLTGMNLLTLLATIGRSGSYPVLVREASTVRNRNSIPIRILKKHLYSTASAIIAVSEGVSNDLKNILGLAERNLYVINNPVNVNVVMQASRTSLSHRWLNNKSSPVFISVGRLSKAKDHETLIKAFSLARRKISAKLIIVGEGPERAHLEGLIQSLELGDSVDMPGHLNNPYTLMAKADVFVLSSRWEGFVNVLLEALALGMPVVSTDCHSSPREILGNGDYGRLVTPGDAQQLAKAMADSLTSRPPPEHQQKRAADYAPEQQFEKYCTLINKLSSESPGTG